MDDRRSVLATIPAASLDGQTYPQIPYGVSRRVSSPHVHSCCSLAARSRSSQSHRSLSPRSTPVRPPRQAARLYSARPQIAMGRHSSTHLSALRRLPCAGPSVRGLILIVRWATGHRCIRSSSSTSKIPSNQPLAEEHAWTPVADSQTRVRKLLLGPGGGTSGR